MATRPAARPVPPGPWLVLWAAAAAGALVVPLAYVASSAAGAGSDRWALLFRTRVPELLTATVLITTAVTAAAAIVGLVLALVVERTDFPGRGALRWILALPLAVPPYIGALTFITTLGPAGWLSRLLGRTPLPVYGFWGAFLVLTAFTYPYVFLTTSAALRRLSRAQEEAARSLGSSSASVIRRVVLPAVRPSVAAGATLVALYVLGDFGAVAMLRYHTLSRAIYFQITGRLDASAAAVLSLVLAALTGIVLAAGWWLARGPSRQVEGRGFGPPAPIPLGRLRPLAALVVAGVVAVSLALPLGVLVYWSARGVWSLDGRFVLYARNSLVVAGLAAGFAAVAAIPVSYLEARHPGPVSTALSGAAHSGYALPGVIAGLGILGVFHRYLPGLYPTAAMLVAACAVRFTPQFIQGLRGSLAQLSPAMEEVARTLGESTAGVLARVVLPLVSPGLLAGAALVFISSLKELTMALLLRPAGFDTLAVRVWMEASEGFYAQAAPPALLIVAVAVLPLKWLVGGSGGGKG